MWASSAGSDAILVQHYGSLCAGSGSRRARSSSIPARPYICRFSILSRFMCPSTGPLLHGSLTADSAALRACFKVRTKRTNEWIPVLRASSIQRWRVVTLPPRRIARKTKNQLAHDSEARAFPLQSIDDLRLLAGQLGAYLAQQCRRHLRRQLC
jgi:hypothetical protein